MRQQTHQPGRRGFSLIELVIVIVIIGVLSAVAIPRFAQASRNQRLEKAAERLIADLELAKTRARASSQSVTVTFDRANEFYQLPAIGGKAFTVELDEAPYDVKIGNVDFNGDEFVTFNAYGVPHSAGFAIVRYQGAEKIRIDVSASGEMTR